jgi:hypothetical protein
MGKREMCKTLGMENLERRDRFGDTDIDGRMILYCLRSEWVTLRFDPVRGFCENTDKSWNSI